MRERERERDGEIHWGEWVCREREEEIKKYVCDNTILYLYYE